jgi:hypothetical protein
VRTERCFCHPDNMPAVPFDPEDGLRILTSDTLGLSAVAFTMPGTIPTTIGARVPTKSDKSKCRAFYNINNNPTILSALVLRSRHNKGKSVIQGPQNAFEICVRAFMYVMAGWADGI